MFHFAIESKYRHLKSLVLFLIVLSTGCHAESLNTAFEQINRAALIESGFLLADDYIFTVGIAKRKRLTTKSKKFALTAAKLIAESRFVWLSYSQISWPDNYSKSLKKATYKQYLNLTSFQFDSSTMTVMDKGKLKKDVYFVILGISADKIKLPSLNISVINQTLTTAFRKQNEKLDLFLYLELATAKKVKRATKRLAEHLGKQYGNGVKTLLSGEKKELSSMAYKSIEQIFSQAELNQLGLSNIFKLVAQNYLDQNICKVIQSNLSERKLEKTAQLFFERCKLSLFLANEHANQT